MAVLIASGSQKKVFNKNIVTIGSTSDCDFVVNIGQGRLVLQYSQNHDKYLLQNKSANRNVLLNGAPVATVVQIENELRLAIANSSDFIAIKVVRLSQDNSNASRKIQQESAVNSTATVLRNLATETTSMSPKEAVDYQKTVLEKLRAPIIKQVGFAINDFKSKLSLNNKASIFTHIALFFTSLVLAFGVSNFITGLKIEETKNFINLPTNIKILVLFTVIIYGLSLILKQGAYLYFHNKKHATHDSKTAEMFFLSSSGAIYTGIYVINLIYYLTINPIFSILMSLFFVALSVILAVACGYFKNSGHEMSYELDKYEYREDFEDIMSEYRLWIERYINTLSDNKINNIKDRLFNLNLKSVWEIILGIITAPFLAYGVSITLAMCFPDAAGWIRISGLRLSPVFLTLATFMIVFAFFSFVNAFLCIRKLQASTVIKNDGFSDYQSHGVNIMGIQGAKKLESEKNRSLIIGCAIIFIEFTMNTSYFCTEIGGDLQGILLSIIAASVPTALLMAETYMLSQTKFDISAGNDLLAKRD